MQKGKWLSEEPLQIAVKRREARSKGERERYTKLNAEFQRITRRNKKVIFCEQCKEIKENTRMGKTRDLFKKIGDIKGIINVRMGMIKYRNGKDLTEQKRFRRGDKNAQNNYTKKVLMTQVTMVVRSVT